ncbi:MAG: FHA domain-containing protein [Myxococcota bacterium]
MQHAFPHDIDPYGAYAESAGRDGFIAQYPHPFLLFARSRLWDATFLKARNIDSSGGTVVVKNPTYDTEGGLALVSGIKKRNDVESTQKGIVLGRATNNDIVVPVASVSSIHANFNAPAQGGGAWTVTDLESSNSTFLNDAKISAYNPMPVADGDYLRFGGNLLCWFITAPRFYELLTHPAELKNHTDP